jgi:hypothetical protein
MITASTCKLMSQITEAKRIQHEAWGNYYRARDQHRPLVEMNTLGDAVARAHTEVLRLNADLERSMRLDEKAARDASRLIAEAEAVK